MGPVGPSLATLSELFILTHKSSLGASHVCWNAYKSGAQ